MRLASAFAQRLAVKLGRTVSPLSSESIRRLTAYHWPGNVRELQNVIERALITSKDGMLNLERALPETADRRTVDDVKPAPGRIRTAKELEDLERANILCALEAAKWKVSGDQGAATLLGMNASTLSSRMKALKIEKPR